MIDRRRFLGAGAAVVGAAGLPISAVESNALPNSIAKLISMRGLARPITADDRLAEECGVSCPTNSCI